MTRSPNIESDRKPKPTVFITGASSGLGAAFARHYARAGYTLGLVARRENKLSELIHSLEGPHFVYAIDVRSRDMLHAAAHDFMRQTGGAVDIVIANAGVSAGTLTESVDDFAVFKEIMDINVLSMVSTFEPFIPAMKALGAGRLVGIASVAGVRGLPGAGAYSASKSAVATYCEALRLEMKPYGVSVVTLAPGYVQSEMTDQNTYKMPFLMPTDVFARKAAMAIQTRCRYVVIPWQMAWVARLMRVLPDWLYDRLAINAPRKARRDRSNTLNG